MPDGSPVRNPGFAHYEIMGPSLLADEPETDYAKPRPEAPWWGALYNHLEARRNALRSWRWAWLLHWQLLAAFFMPRRWQFLAVVANRMWKGAPINDQIINSEGLQAVGICGSGMFMGLMDPARPWYVFEAAPPGMQERLDQAGKTWLEDAGTRVRTVIDQSNWNIVMPQVCEDLVVFGTAPFLIYEDMEEVIRLYQPCPGEYYLGAGARLTIDTLNREYVQTILQVIEFFGLENVPAEIQQMWKTKGGSIDTEVVICHSVEPNFAVGSPGQRDKVRPIPSSFAWRETYWLRGNKGEKPLSIRGFHEKPFVAPRWAVASNEPYGRSPCMNALGDNKQVQMEELRKAEFIEKGVRPPMGADPELKNEPASIIPARITYMNTAGGKKGFWPLFEVNPAWLQWLVQDITAVVARIKSCLFVDVFLAISQMAGVQPRNELELTKRDLERLMRLGPVIELFEREGASPALQRIFAIMMRRGMFPPVPPSLQGVPLKINYTSIIRLALQASEAVGLKDFITGMGAASAAAKAATLPDPLRIVNLEQWARDFAKATHQKVHLLYTPDEVKEHDAARAAEIAKAHQGVEGRQDAMAGVQAAGILGKTPLGNGTVLDQLTGAPGGR